MEVDRIPIHDNHQFTRITWRENILLNQIQWNKNTRETNK